MAANSGRRFAVSRSSSHAMTLGDPKYFSNCESDHERNFLEPNGPETIRLRKSRRSQ